MNTTQEKVFETLGVTNVQVFPYKNNPDKSAKAVATIILNDQIQIRGLRVIDGVNGLFVGYPIDKNYNSKDYRTVCFPITRQLREHIENCVLEKYYQVIKEHEEV